MKFLVLLAIIVFIVLVVAVIALSMRVMSMHRRIKFADDWRMGLSRKQRRSYAQGMLERSQEEYDLAQQERFTNIIRDHQR